MSQELPQSPQEQHTWLVQHMSLEQRTWLEQHKWLEPSSRYHQCTLVLPQQLVLLLLLARQPTCSRELLCVVSEYLEEKN